MPKLSRQAPSADPSDSQRFPAQKPVPIWVSVRLHPAPGKAQDYESYLKTDLMPVYAKAKAAGKIAGYSVTRRSFGQGSGDRIIIIVSLSKAADLEAGKPSGPSPRAGRCGQIDRQERRHGHAC